VAENDLVKDKEATYARLMERKTLQGTAVGNGIAIPHCFAYEIPKLVIIMARLQEGIEFGSFEREPSRFSTPGKPSGGQPEPQSSRANCLAHQALPVRPEDPLFDFRSGHGPGFR
jgi:hypothetical protein